MLHTQDGEGEGQIQQLFRRQTQIKVKEHLSGANEKAQTLRRELP